MEHVGHGGGQRCWWVVKGQHALDTDTHGERLSRRCSSERYGRSTCGSCAHGSRGSGSGSSSNTPFLRGCLSGDERALPPPPHALHGRQSARSPWSPVFGISLRLGLLLRALTLDTLRGHRDGEGPRATLVGISVTAPPPPWRGSMSLHNPLTSLSSVLPGGE